MHRALTASLLAHAALIAAMLLTAATRAPVRMPELPRRVRLVADLLPASAARTPRPAAPPARVVEPAPAAPAPRPRPGRPAPAADRPEPRAPEPIVVPKVSLPPPAARPGPRPATARPGAGPVLTDRLAARLAAVAPPPAAVAAPAVPASPRVAALSPPHPAAPATPIAPATRSGAAPAPEPGLEVAMGDFPHAWYAKHVLDTVYERWQPPSEPLLGTDAVAVVSFTVDRAGRVAGAALRSSSGSTRFDRSALAAVRGLAGLRSLPPDYREDTLAVAITFRNLR